MGRPCDSSSVAPYALAASRPQTFTVRARWSRVGSEWKIVDADIISRE